MAIDEKSPITVLNCLHDARFGGPQRRVLTVGQLLQREAVETTAVVPATGGNAVQQFADGGVATEQLQQAKIPNPRKLGELTNWFASFPGDVRRFGRLFAQRKPDVVHVNGIYLVAPALAAKWAGIPVMWHLNDTGLPPRLARIMGGIAYRIADLMVAAASAVGRHHGLADDQFEVLFAPVDTSKFTPDTGSEQGSTIKVGIVANWNHGKGHDQFVRVLKDISDRLAAPVQGVIIGSYLDNHKDYYDGVMKLADDLGMRDKLDIRGFVAEPAALIREFDLLLLTSASEACPIAVLEAMSCGVPVVAYQVGGVREMLQRPDQECGAVVPRQDPDAMAEASIRILTDDELHGRMSRNGRSVAVEIFDTSSIAQKHETLYRGLAGKHRGKEVS